MESNPSQSLTPPNAPAPRHNWLLDPAGERMLLPLTGLWILGLDWLLFSEDAMSLGLATPITIVLGFLLGGLGTYFFQRRYAKDDRLWAAIKAFAAGCVVGIPFPLAGTVVGGWILLVSGLSGVKNQLHKK